METARDLFKALEAVDQASLKGALRYADPENTEAFWKGLGQAMRALSNIWGAEVLREETDNGNQQPNNPATAN